MTADRDLYAAADTMIERFGEDAEIEAAMRADDQGNSGDAGRQQTPSTAH